MKIIQLTRYDASLSSLRLRGIVWKKKIITFTKLLH